MADAQANINVNLDTSDALAQLKILQRQISSFHQAMAIGGAKARAESAQLSQTLINTVNSSGKFSASIQRTLSTTESFTNALERNKLSMTQYFRFGVGATKNFGKVFRSEFATIDKVARERVKTLQTQYIQLGRDANGAMQSIAVRPLALDMKNLGTQVMMTAQRQQIFNQLLRQGSTNLLNFGKNTQWAGRQLMVGFTIPLSIMGATAGREFMKLEEQAVKFRRVYGDMFTTSADTEKALDSVRELADEFTKYGIAVEKTLDLAAKVAQMGNMGDALEAQVTQATRLAVLGGLEQQEALDTTISLTNAFGVSTEDLAGKIAFLNAAENQTILAIEDFNEAIPKAGSVVKQLGGDVEDLAFFLTAMREGGINASRGANALKSSLGRLINPTDVAREKLGEFGIDILSIVENNAGNLREMVLELGYELDRLDPLDRARAIEQLFGKFQFARMSTMFQNIVKDGTQARKVLDLTANSTEELAILAERELSRVEDSVSFKFQKQIEKLQAALAPIGGEFIKAILPLLEGATKILKMFNGMSDGAKQFTVIAVAAVGVIAPTFLMLFGLLANGFANFIKGITQVFGGLGMLAGRSQMVGGSMAYMTQEQLEAQAVSSSLQQTHQTLTQTFTSEVGAVNTLAAAYEAAIQKLQRFNAAAASTAATTGAAAGAGAAGAAGAAGRSRYNPFMPPKKYNKGVVMVPGPKGKGDIVPAMLTPGEAVIPAEETQKYLPLIKGIINDSLPGYAESNVSELPATTQAAQRIAGRVGPGGSRATNIIKSLEGQIVSLVKNLGLTVEQAEQRVSSSLKNLTVTSASALESTKEFQDIRKDVMLAKPQELHMDTGSKVSAQTATGMTGAGGQMIDTIAAVNPDAQVDFKTGWTRRGSQYENLQMSSKTSSVGLGAQEALDNYDRFGGVEKWQEGIKEGGADLETLSESAKQQFVSFDSRIKELIAESINDNVEYIADTEADIEGFVQKAVDRGDISDTEEAKAGLRSKYASMEAIEQRAADETLTGEAAGIRETARKKARSVRYKSTAADVQQAQAMLGSSDPRQREQGQAFLDLYSEKGEPAAGVGRERKFPAGTMIPEQPEAGMPTQDAQEDAQEYGQTLEQALESASQDPYMYVRDRMSPHEMAGPDGQSDATEYGTEFANTLNQQGGNLQPPTPPGDLPLPGAPSAPGAGGTGKQNIRTRIGGFVSSGVERFSQTKLGQRAGEKLAGMSGVALSDNQGNIVYDPNQDPTTWAGKMEEANQRVSNSVDELTGNLQEADAQIDNYSQSVENSGDAAQRAGQEQDLAPDPRTGEMIPKAQADRIARREDRRQRRQARAGKALVGLGAATGGLAAATQINVEVPGIGNIGEFAQKLMPVTGALTALAPILLALPLPIAALVAVIGTGVFLWMRHNKQLKEAREEAYKFTKALGTGEEEMEKFAEFAGNVSSQELLSRRIQNIGRPLQKAPGETTFGEAFSASDIGEEYISNIREAVSSVGSAQAGQMLFSQLSSAIISNVLTIDQARSIANAVGEAIGDYSISLDVQSQLLSLIGPNGEDVLKDPLQLSAIVTEVSSASGEGAALALEAMSEPVEPFDPEVLERFITERTQTQSSIMLRDLDVGTALTGWMSKLTDQDLLGRRTLKDISDLSDQDRADIQEQYGVSAEVMQRALIDPMSDAGQEFFTSAYQKLIEEDPDSIGEMVLAGLRSEAAIITQENIGKGIGQLENFYATVQSGLASVVLAADDSLNSAKQALVEARESGDAEAIAEAEEAVSKAERDRELALANLREENRILRQEANRSLLEIDVPERSQAFESQDARITSDLEGQELRDMNNLLSLLSSTDDEDYETNVILRGMLEDGDIEALTLSNLLTGLDQEASDMLGDVVADMSFDVGEDYAAKFAELLTGIEDPEVVSEILFDADGTIRTPSQTIDYINSLGSLISLGSMYGEVGSEARTFYEENVLGDPLMTSRYEQNREAVEGLAGDYSQKSLESAFGEQVGGDIYAALEVDREKWDELSDEAKAGLVTDLSVGVTLVGDQPVIDFIKSTFAGTDIAGEDEVVNTREEIVAGTGQRAYDYRPKQDVPAPGTGEPPKPPEPKGGDAGGPEGSILDDIVKASRDFGNIGQELTTGLEASLEAIMNMAEGTAFGLNGLSRRLRNLSVPETMIDQFLGMPPEEWEEYKKELFVVDETGTPTALSEKGEKVMEAQRQATIAEEIDNVEEQIATTEDQITAFDRLTASGADAALAYDMISNKALASAIANAKTTAQVKRLIEVQKELKELQEELEEINEEEQRKQRISDAVEEMNKKFNDQVKALNKIRNATDEYTDAQIESIMKNDDLMALFLEPDINPGALEQALENAEKQAKLELDIKLLTFEGREDYLSEAFKKAKDKLSAEETRINLEFDAEVSGQEKIIEAAEEEIDALSYMIDDYQAGITEIQNQEEIINEAYEKRFEALDKIADINDRIAAQQKNQLDLAEALSRGDIAAAAQAAQTMRDQEQKDAIDSQREMLEQRQKAEIAALRSTSGMTRDELEDQVKFLEDRIFQIEERQLEPAQEYIRLAERRRDTEIENLQVLGRTSTQWDLIQNNLDVARTRNYEFMNDMQKQFDMYPEVLQRYLQGEPLPAPPALPKPPPPPRPSGGGKDYKWEGDMAGRKGRAERAKARAQVKWRKDKRAGKSVGAYPAASGGLIARMAMGGYMKGGMFTKMGMGGKVPSYMAFGGMSLGSDTIPTLLTPGEFVVRRPAVSMYGVDKLESINRGTHSDGSVYNYNLAVNVKSDSNPEQIANTVMREIKRIDSQRIRNNRY